MTEAANTQPKVYFNQSNSILTVTGLANKKSTLKIFSLSGQMVYSQQCHSDMEQMPLKLNKGIYSYSIEQNGKMINGKFEIVR
ncbi:MAG: T9SS type A sorting domain-containing protein [Bacteroidota bacterium]|nr:MAG: T9SS type A sorting domain-containing protein [Bacteroidota bacterium]